MKKGFFVLAFVSLFATACSKNSPNNAGSDNSKPANIKPNPLPPLDPDPIPDPIDPPKPPKPVEKYEYIKFGTDGLVTLNKETKEYVINKIPTSVADVEFLQPSKGYFDSFVNDPEYDYRSSIFPVDKYSLYQIPEILTFDKENSVNGRPSDGKYDASLTFWGAVGKFPGRAYYACYKSVDHSHSKFAFIVDAYEKNETCSELKNSIDTGKIKTLKINGGEFIMLRFYGFRAYSFGDCFDYKTCVISYNSKVKYFTQIK